MYWNNINTIDRTIWWRLVRKISKNQKIKKSILKIFKISKIKERKENFEKTSNVMIHCVCVIFALKFVKNFRNFCFEKKNLHCNNAFAKQVSITNFESQYFKIENMLSISHFEWRNEYSILTFERNVDANLFVVIILNIVDCWNDESIISRKCLSTIFFLVFSFFFSYYFSFNSFRVK